MASKNLSSFVWLKNFKEILSKAFGFLIKFYKIKLLVSIIALFCI